MGRIKDQRFEWLKGLGLELSGSSFASMSSVGLDDWSMSSAENAHQRAHTQPLHVAGIAYNAHLEKKAEAKCLVWPHLISDLLIDSTSQGAHKLLPRLMMMGKRLPLERHSKALAVCGSRNTAVAASENKIFPSSTFTSSKDGNTVLTVLTVLKTQKWNLVIRK